MIYHYTSTAALTNIIVKKMDEKKELCSMANPLEEMELKLRFSHYRFLNDASEGDELQKIFSLVCEELLKEKRIGSEIYSGIQFNDRIMIGSTRMTNSESILRLTEEDCDSYICCFSYDRDSLPMWRYYSHGLVGCNLEFHKESLKKELRIQELNPRENYVGKTILENVIYNDGKKKELVQQCILDSVENHKDVDNICSDIRNKLYIFKFLFKNECFSTENEVRAIIHIPRDGSKHGDKEKFEIKFREKEGIIIPFIERRIPISALIGINISPMASNDVVESVRDYVVRYTGIDRVFKSKLPVRY